MRDAMRAGGPDGAGSLICEDGAVALGHRRLAVIELSPLGAQPMTWAAGRYAITFNGEIYNHADVRGELEALGHRFRSHSDTEVILAAFATWGTACAERLRGMWAFAIHDAVERKLWLCRDRIGVKPLFWWMGDDGLFLFASELKGLLAHPALPRRLDPSGVRLFLQYNYVPWPHCIVAGVQKLPPGAWLELSDDGSVRIERWWDLAKRIVTPIAVTDEAAADRELEERLIEGARLRLVSDVPVGLFLSGGIDSSLLLALLSKGRAAGDALNTFTVGFGGGRYDESAAARAISAALGSTHHELHLDHTAALGIVPRLPEIWDEPLGDSSCLPTWLVAGFARQHVTVALSADGGDELFGGYPKYWRSAARAERLARSLSLDRLGAALPRGALEALGRLGIGTTRLLRAQEILGGKRALTHACFVAAQQAFSDRELDGLLIDQRPLPATSFDAWDSFAALPDLNRMMAMDVLTYHVDGIHAKVDRATMAHGLEGREPFVDHRLIEHALALPPAYKIRGEQGKQPLRRLLAKHLDPALIDQGKRGFSPPLAEWLTAELAPLIDENCRAAGEGLLDPSAVAEVATAFRRRARHNTQRLWNLIVLGLWRRHWGM